MCVARCMCVCGCERRGATSGAWTLADPQDTGLAVGTAVSRCSWSWESEGHEPWRKASPGPRGAWREPGEAGSRPADLRVEAGRGCAPCDLGTRAQGRGRGCWRGNQKRGKWPAACFEVQEHSGDQPSVLRHRGLMKTKGEAAGWQQNH